MAFDRQVITTKGLTQLKALADNVSYELRFTKCAAYEESIDLENCYAGTFNNGTPLDTENLGFIWSVTPTEFYKPDSNLRVVTRFQRKYTDNVLHEGTVNIEKAKSFALWAELYTKEVDIEGNATYTAVINSETLIAVASNDDREISIPQGLDHALYMTFSLIVTNGFDRISAVSNGVALIGDLALLKKDTLKGLTISFDTASRDLILKDSEGKTIDIANIPAGSGDEASPFEAVLVQGNQNIQGVKTFTNEPEAEMRQMVTEEGIILVTKPKLEQYVFTDDKGVDSLSDFSFESDDHVLNGFELGSIEKPVKEEDDTAETTYQKTTLARQAYFSALEHWLNLSPSVSNGVTVSSEGVTIIENSDVKVHLDSEGISLESFGLSPDNDKEELNFSFENKTFLSLDTSGRIGGSPLCTIIVFLYLDSTGDISSKITAPKGFKASLVIDQGQSSLVIEDLLRDSSCAEDNKQDMLDNLVHIGIETSYSSYNMLFKSLPLEETPTFTMLSVWKPYNDHRCVDLDIQSIVSKFVYATITQSTVLGLKISIW